MQTQNNQCSAYDFNSDTFAQIKPLKHRIFKYMSLGEKYVLWQRFNTFYSKLETVKIGCFIYRISYFLADETTEKFYIQQTDHKVAVEYLYSLFKSFIKCTDVVVTNQLYVAIIADELGKSVFWIKDNFAKKQKNALSVLKNYPNIQQLAVNFDIKKTITEYLQNKKPKSNIDEKEFLSSNPFPQVDVALKPYVQKSEKELKNTVKIVFTTDENYAIMTAVAIQSAIEHKKDSSVYDINIVGYNLSVATRWCFAAMERVNIKITIINVDNIDKFNDIKQTRHLNQTALLIFDLPEILADTDKVLYLDGDIFVQGDLSEFFHTNINEYYAAVIRSAALINPEKHRQKSKCSNDNYFNGGVILMNLNRMRQDNVSEKMLAWKKENEGFFMNQDALNMILSVNVKEMSCWHNFLAYYPFIYTHEELEKFYHVKLPNDLIKIYKKALILHYPGKVKPYMQNMGWLTAEFMRYISQTEFDIR